MSLLAGSAVLLLSLLLLHALFAPLLHAGAHWLYRGRPTARPDRARTRAAFLLLGLPPVLVAALGLSSLAHLASSEGTWASLLAICHRWHEHCDVLLGQNTSELPIYVLLVGLVVAWVGRAGWQALAPLVRARRLPTALLHQQRRLKLARAVSSVPSLGDASVRAVTGVQGWAVSVGLLRPLVLVSEDLVELLSEAELGAVLAHEAAHARGRDGLRSLVIRFTRALSPLSYPCRAERAYELDREILCDDAAVGQGVDPLALASALVAVSRLQISPMPSAAPAALGHHDTERAVRTRVGLLLARVDAAPPRTGGLSPAVASLLLLAAVALPHVVFSAITLVHCAVESLVHVLS